MSYQRNQLVAPLVFLELEQVLVTGRSTSCTGYRICTGRASACRACRYARCGPRWRR